MTTHLVRGCPYWTDADAWLTEFTQEGFASLVEEAGAPCEPCLAVVNQPPMNKPDGSDDGRLTWHIHCLLRESLRSALAAVGYEQVVTDGWAVLYRGPSADIEVRWNTHWRAGT